MVDKSISSIDRIVAMYVGPNTETTQIAAEVLTPEHPAQITLFQNLFFKPFTSFSTSFSIPNMVQPGCELTTQLANKEVGFAEFAHSLANHLCDCIAGIEGTEGVLFVVESEELVFNAQAYKGYVLSYFRDEELFITHADMGNGVQIDFNRGLISRKPERSMLLILTEEGWVVFNQGVFEPLDGIWEEAFIPLEVRKDHMNLTSGVMHMAKTFIAEKIPEHFEIDRADQIDLLNRTAGYFKNKQQFNQDEFGAEVLRDEKVVASFNEFDREFRTTHDLPMEPDFQIAPDVVKKQGRVFKSILKLDKNFHIYIHGDRSLIHRGQEPDGRKFYKVYFQNED